MEDKTYSFHLYVSCEDAKSEDKFNYGVSINSHEIEIHTSNKCLYTKTPKELEEIEQKLKDEEKKELIRNLRFQNKVNVKIEDGKYKIIRD